MKQSIVSLNDHYLVGSAASGHDFVQNMYGMYIRYEQGLNTSKTNLEISAIAQDKLYKPLFWTSLGWISTHDPISSETITNGIRDEVITTSQLLRMKRDYKDVLVSIWKTWSSESSWEEFCASPIGLSMIKSFEEAANQFTYDVVISYEDLVENPQRVLTSIVTHLLPRQDNPELETFGLAKRVVNLDVIDSVTNDSNVRECREGMSQGLLESVGVWKQFISKTQAEEVDEFLATL